MFDNCTCNFVVYLLLDHGFSAKWVSNIDNYLMAQQQAKVVFVGDQESCDRFAKSSELVVPNSRNLQIDISKLEFYRDLAGYHRLHSPCLDLLIIKSDVFIAQSDPDIFRRAISRNSSTGTVSPLTDQGNLFGLFEKKQKVLSLELIGKLLCRIDDAEPFETPFFFPNMVYWRCQALYKALLANDSKSDDNNLAISASLAGYLHVVTPQVYIQDNSRQAAKVIKKIETSDLSQAIARRHPLTGLRHRMADLVINVQSHESNNDDRVGPVQLHVMHSWGGGLHRWVCDYNNADSTGRNYTLKSIGDWEAFGKRLSLYNHPDDDQAIRHWDLYHPIHGTAIVHLQYAKIIKEIVHEYGIDFILVSSLIGHSLDILDVDIKTALVLHDYYPFCPAIYIYYDGICHICEKEKLRKCEANNPLNYLFKGITTEQWMSVRKRYISLITRNNIDLIVPSRSVARHFESLIPDFRNREFKCISHGLPDHLEFVQKVKPSRKNRLKILILGKLDPHKGLALLLQIAKEIEDFADLILLGCGEAGSQFSKIDGVTIEQSYDYSELNEKLCSYAPDLGLLFSIWPETYGYTLSELMIHAIPTVVSARGAPLDRIIDQENGFLVEPDPQQVLSLLRDLARNPDRLDKVRRRLSTDDFRAASRMVGEYQHLLDPSGAEQLNSYAMKCLSEQPPQAGQNHAHTTYVGEGDFFEIMQQLQSHLIGMVNKVPGIGRTTRKFFAVCVRIWIFFPVRFASWYVRRK